MTDLGSDAVGDQEKTVTPEGVVVSCRSERSTTRPT